VLIRENLGAATLAVPVRLRARMTVERELFTRQYRGEPIGALPDLHVPGRARALRAVALDSARKFVADMARQGNNAVDEPGGFRLYGPYQSRDGYLGADRANGSHQFEDKHPESADFVLEGAFIATRGKVVEAAPQ
jgi:hypothetical protein